MQDLCGMWPSLCQLLLAGAVQRLADTRLRGAFLHLRSQGFAHPCPAHQLTARSNARTVPVFRDCLLPRKQLTLSQRRPSSCAFRR